MTTHDSTPMVEAKALRKEYGTTRAVSDVSFRISRGEVVGFLGPNGAGKSTTMKLLTGYLRPTAGTAFVAGIPVDRSPLEARRRLGYLPENAPLYDDLQVIDFLEYVARLRGIARPKLKVLCERCGIVDVLGKDIGQLSKGYRQRVGLAQAMLHDPDLLILDEPTTGLDPNQIVEIRELIRDLGREKTVLLSTHILPEVQAVCDRILILHDGTIVADDSPAALTGGGAGAAVRVVLRGKAGGAIDAGAARAALARLPGVHEARGAATDEPGAVAVDVRAAGTADPREAIFGAAVEHGWVLVELTRERASLEETFRRLTRVANG